MKDVLVLLATGFEDTELITTINIFDRENISFDLVSIENLTQVKGQRHAIVKTKTFENLNTDNYKLVFLPGVKGHEILLKNSLVIEILKKYHKNKKIAAICAAPKVLLKAGVINQKFTAYPGFANHKLNTGNDVEVNDKIITGKDFLATPKFAYEIVKKIKSI